MSMKPAGLLRSFGALTIDYMLIGLYANILVAAVFLLGIKEINLENFTDVNNAVVFLQVVFAISYFVYMESSDKQATFGKYISGLKVVDNYGNRISAETALVRVLSSAANILTFGLGYLLIGLSESKRGLHDIISGTVTVITDDKSNFWSWFMLLLVSNIVVFNIILGRIIFSEELLGEVLESIEHNNMLGDNPAMESKQYGL